MCTTPKKHKLLFLLFKSKKENISLIKNAKTCFRFFSIADAFDDDDEEEEDDDDDDDEDQSNHCRMRQSAARK